MPKVAKGLLLLVSLALVLSVAAPLQAAPDPQGSLDSLWYEVSVDSGYVVKVQIRGTSDNTLTNKIAGYGVPVLIKWNSGINKVDTTVAATFAGAVSAAWPLPQATSGPGGVDPAVSPFHFVIGNVTFGAGWTGTNQLLATIRIVISGNPDTLTIDTLTAGALSLSFVTESAIEYVPAYATGGFYYNPLDVKDSHNGNITSLPKDYTLNQNFPNPFNATTQIQFALPKSSHVKLEIFNVLGQKVKTLVDEELQAGYKQVTWDGKDQRGNLVSTGIYFYRIKAENQFTDMRKMLLIK